MSKVSVIIPTYNRAKGVVNAVDSVLAQSYKDLEVVVIDDGSDDDTESVLKGYGDRIVYINGGHRGSIAARNAGIKQSSGEYIAFLDSDDAWLPDKLSRQVGILEEEKGVGLVYTDMFLVDEGGKTGKRFSDWADPHEGKVFGLLLEGNFVSMSSSVVRKACLDRVGLLNESDAQIGVEDLHLWLRLTRYYDVRYIPEPLVNYSVGGADKLTHDSRINKLIKTADVLNDIGKDTDLNAEDRRLLRNAEAFKYYEIGRLLGKSGAHEDAAGRFSSAIRLDPLYLRAYFFLLASRLR